MVTKVTTNTGPSFVTGGGGQTLGSSVNTFAITNNWIVGDKDTNLVLRPIGLTDLTNANNLVGFKFPYTSIPASTNNNLFGALQKQVGISGGTYNAVYINPYWDSTGINSYTGVVWAAGDLCLYYDGRNTSVYTCVTANPGSITPDSDTNYWTYLDSYYTLRLVPSEDATNPLLSGNNRFNYYSVITCYQVDDSLSGFQGDFTSYIYELVCSASFLSTNSYVDVVTVNGANGSPSLAITGISGSVSGTTVTVTHASTTYPMIVGNKVKVNGFDYVGVSSSTMSIPMIATVTTSSATGFTATISTSGAYSGTTTYIWGDFVTSGGNVYVHKDLSGATTGVAPTVTATWSLVSGTLTSTNKYADTIIKSWELYNNNDRFNVSLIPDGANSNSASDAKPKHTISSYQYNQNIVNQKQTLFSINDYFVYQGFPFDKASAFGTAFNFTASIADNSISAVTTRPVITEITMGSDNRYLPNSTTTSSFPLSSSSVYSWNSYSGTSRALFGLANNTSVNYQPDLLDGIVTSNYSGNTTKLSLISPDISSTALTTVSSMSFAESDFVTTAYNPFKINGSSLNDFTALAVVYLDYVTDDVINTPIVGDSLNWYGIMSETDVITANTTSVNLNTLSGYKATDPRISVRYISDGTITVNLGDRVLTAIKTLNGHSRPYQPMIVGLSISQSNKTVTLTVVDNYVRQSTASFTRSIANPISWSYGVTPFDGNFHGAKMYILEINHYYSSKSYEFLKKEIDTLDQVYAIGFGRKL
jgi:hypothetical protein